MCGLSSGQDRGPLQSPSSRAPVRSPKEERKFRTASSSQCHSVPRERSAPQTPCRGLLSLLWDSLGASPSRSFLLRVEAKWPGKGAARWDLGDWGPSALGFLWRSGQSPGWNPHPGPCSWRPTEDTGYAQRRRQEGARPGGQGLEGWGTQSQGDSTGSFCGKMCGETGTGGRGPGKGHSLVPRCLGRGGAPSMYPGWTRGFQYMSSGTRRVWSLTSTLPSGAGEQSTGPCCKTGKGAAG